MGCESTDLSGDAAMVKLRYLIWLVRMRYVWFLRRPLPGEFQTRIYEGLPGSGKTLLMVRDAVTLMRSGVRVCSNLRIRDIYSGSESERCATWIEMLEWSVQTLRDGVPTVFCLDEIHLMCDSREWKSTPSWWRNLMAQRRHFGIGIIGTTQDLSQVEKRLRTLVKHLIRVRRVRLWKLPVYRTSMLDPSTVDNPAGAATPIGSSRWEWVPAHAFHSYSTREVMKSEDMSLYSDDALADRIASLSDEAFDRLSLPDLPAFSDLSILDDDPLSSESV